MVNGSILIVDPDAAFGRALADALTSNGFDTRVARDEHKAMEAIEARRPALILLDSRLSDHGDGLLPELSKRGLRFPIVLVASANGAELAREFGISAYLEKPQSAERFLGAICICGARTSARKDRLSA